MERWKASAPRKHKPDSRCHSKCEFVGPEKIEAVVPQIPVMLRKFKGWSQRGSERRAGVCVKSGERYSR